MFFDSYLSSIEVGAPRTFAGLMELYEDNYIKLRRLIPDIEAVEVGAVSHVHGGVDLLLKVLERQKYTTTLYLTYFFERDNGAIQEPSMTVRMYSDARTAEVLVDENAERFDLEFLCPQRTDVSLDMRWQMNWFLNRWLTYCLQQGHSFNLATEMSHDAEAVVADVVNS